MSAVNEGSPSVPATLMFTTPVAPANLPVPPMMSFATVPTKVPAGNVYTVRPPKVELRRIHNSSPFAATQTASLLNIANVNVPPGPGTGNPLQTQCDPVNLPRCVAWPVSANPFRIGVGQVTPAGGAASVLSTVPLNGTMCTSLDSATSRVSPLGLSDEQPMTIVAASTAVMRNAFIVVFLLNGVWSRTGRGPRRNVRRPEDPSPREEDGRLVVAWEEERRGLPEPDILVQALSSDATATRSARSAVAHPCRLAVPFPTSPGQALSRTCLKRLPSRRRLLLGWAARWSSHREEEHPDKPEPFVSELAPQAESLCIRETRLYGSTPAGSAQKAFPVSNPRDETPAEPLTSAEGHQITGVLTALRSGDRAAFDELLPLVYEMLRRMARRQLGDRQEQTLNATGLVHEAWLKLVDTSRAEWTDRAHFFRVASIAMRQILIGYARARAREKRGGEFKRVTLDDNIASAEDRATALVELDEALVRLATLDARLVRVVECRFFAGLSEEETAATLGVTERTVRRDWVKARALLYELLAA